jgi:hypothetical protein
VDSSIRDDFDTWLTALVHNAMHLPGIADCNWFRSADSDNGRASRTCLYVLGGNDALDAFLDGAGADMEIDASSRFGELVTVSTRVLREDHTVDEAPAESPDCLNCGARLKGQYCGNCGQRSRSRLISLWELVSDAFDYLVPRQMNRIGQADNAQFSAIRIGYTQQDIEAGRKTVGNDGFHRNYRNTRLFEIARHRNATTDQHQ